MLRIFARHGVPTRVAAPPPEPEPPSLCSGDEVETLVARFLDAFNSGDLKGLDDVFAHEPDFEWYSTGAPGERFTPLANDRPSLVPYFATRHALDEQLTLRSFRFNGNSASRQPYGNFEYGLTRRAEDLPATPYNGERSRFLPPHPIRRHLRLVDGAAVGKPPQPPTTIPDVTTMVVFRGRPAATREGSARPALPPQ